ncbi:thioesterase II family protein [Micromonospora carbonacea]|uniref:Thioesterase n=1 Tax=Micromonospora carbonacea TaxID=47853 RepID=A0A7H8XVN7_9ACTN|nr:alpha/beta fold hydrolase [Micromonospora carbonacea]MBB5828573.1 surfactin synthase thioesterase subunit [Micromonospora carbonacea]QLD28379.2 thioesterase [Micromonospora carbonacea]
MSPSADPSELWLRRYRPVNDPAVRLFCFPHAGGAASAYLPFARRLAADVDVLAVQYPGRQDRRGEPLIESVDALVDGLLPALLAWADRPVAFFGHSMGATVAFEAARRLPPADADRLVHLFASGRRSPSVGRRDRFYRFDDELIDEIRRLQGTDSSLLDDRELLDMLLPAIRNDYRAAAAYEYRPGPRLRCPVTVLAGAADTHVTTDEAAAWAEVTAAATMVRTFPGGHFYLNDQLDAVCAEVTTTLAAVSTTALTAVPGADPG